MIRIENSWEAFGALGFGGWNDCPEARIHVAIHKRWRDRYGSSPIVISADVVECHVSRPPDNEQAALELAREQYAFCPDIVDQGTETISALAASLLGSPRWYFWWD